jgi:fused signal recognition particle receptor
VFKRKDKKEQPEAPAREGFVKRLRARLNRGGGWLSYDLANLAPGGRINEDVLDELESRLILADIGVDATERILEQLRKRLARKELKDVAALEQGLRNILVDMLAPIEQPLDVSRASPFVILVVGVNGAGKTTTIGKLAKRFQDDGLSVMLAAGDTFRAAAIEQLRAWGERNGVPVVAQERGADPAAVVFDAFDAARAREMDVLIADTAGRLQSQQGLMDELAKIKRVLGRRDESAPHEVLLVLDAGLGQNALVQAEKFNDALGVTGVAVTKLDGTAKGGILVAMAHRFGIPVRYIGIGEAAEDMQPFVAAEYVDAMLRPDVAEGGTAA